jgi:glycosyltransferase involved in cell wall biosynthesis
LPLAQAVVARGHAAALFVPPYDGPADSGLCWREAGVSIFNVPVPHGAGQNGAGGASGLAHLQLAQHLLAAVRAWHPEVVHVFKPKGPSGLVAAALWLMPAWPGRRPGLFSPSTLVIDSDDWEGAGGWNDDPRAGYSDLQRRVFAWQERYGLAHAQAWTVASACLAERAVAMGADPAQVLLLPNGVSPSWLAATEATAAHLGSGTRSGSGPDRAGGAPPSVLLYTRFAGVRVDDVVDIWRRVANLAPEATLTVVGRGLSGEERILADTLPKVEVLGWVEPAQMPLLFAGHTLAIVPWADTPPNRARNSAKVLELMAAGLPIVAYAVGELPATLAGAGVPVPPGEAAAFAHAVADLLANPARAAQLGAAARARVHNHYTWDHLAEAVLQVYGKVIGHQSLGVTRPS